MNTPERAEIASHLRSSPRQHFAAYLLHQPKSFPTPRRSSPRDWIMEWELDGKREEDKDNNSIELQRIERTRPDRPLPAVPASPAAKQDAFEATSPKEKGEWRRNI